MHYDASSLAGTPIFCQYPAQIYSESTDIVSTSYLPTINPFIQPNVGWRYRVLQGLADWIDTKTAIRHHEEISDADIYTDVGLVFRENFLEGVCRHIDAKCVPDLGSGDGYHAIHLSRSVETVVAVDRDRVANKILY